MIGQIIGNYKVEEKIGEGGMGSVYRGVDTMLDREVAIKALRPELASQDSIVERFRKEAVTLAKLNHPNIATLYSLFRHGNELYMVLEFVRGETLDSIMTRRGALPAEEAIPVFCQVLDGIDHAHDLGIVHRDIKPANLMLTEKGTLKVLDFGIARLLGSTRMTRAGNIIGTLEYMAPEQVRGLDTDGRADIYALGMMLYEVLTGRLPFETQNEFELMKLQTEQMPLPPRELNPAIPEEVEEAIINAIRKDPAERFQTAGDFRDMLLEAGLDSTAVIRGSTGSYRRASTSRPPVSKPERLSAEIPHATSYSPLKTDPLPVSDKIEQPRTPVIAHTRIGTLPDQRADIMKATRLGAPPVAAAASATATPGSFLGRLGLVHYVVAGLILLVLIGSVGAVSILYFVSRGVASNTISNKKNDSIPNIETNKTNDVPDATSRQIVQETPRTADPSPTATSQSPEETTVERPNREPRITTPRTAPAPKKVAPAQPKKQSGCSDEDSLRGKC